jgi:hypothetical protein
VGRGLQPSGEASSCCPLLSLKTLQAGMSSIVEKEVVALLT